MNVNVTIENECFDLNYIPITHLSLRGAGISSVEPLRKCKNLVFLGLANNSVADLTPLNDLKRIINFF